MNGSGQGYTCPTCGRVSYHPMDLQERFCSTCGFENEAAAEARARAAFRDDAFGERRCDHCGRLYRGPAVYCSFACAVVSAS